MGEFEKVYSVFSSINFCAIRLNKVIVVEVVHLCFHNDCGLKYCWDHQRKKLMKY